MNINNIFAYGSTANVLVRVNSARTINSVAYTAGEPYTILENVPIEFSYSGEQVLINERGVLGAYKTDYPVAITIKGINLTDKISALIFDKVASTASVTKIIQTPQIQSAAFYIETAATNLFLYKDAQPNTSFTFVNGLVTIADFSATATYILIYSVVTAKDKIGLSLPHNAYFTLEIFGKGEKNGAKTSIFMRLNKCSLMTDKQMTFNSNSGNNIDLLFAVIKDDGDFLTFGE